MKKIIYAALICIIIAGTIITCTIGLNVDIDYAKNTQIEIYIGKQVENKDIEQIVKEVFPNETVIVRKVEVYNDMVAVTISQKSDEEIQEQLKQLNTKINEKYEVENTVEDEIVVKHNSNVRLSNILKPYIAPIAISTGIILLYAIIRYRKLGVLKTLLTYILVICGVGALYISIFAITRTPVNKMAIPVGLALYVITLTILEWKNMKKLNSFSLDKKED